MKYVTTLLLTFLITLAHAQDGIPDYPGELTPVQFIDLKTTQENDIITFTWRTASEQDNHYFFIEQSTNAQHWKEIATIQGSGTTKTISTYTYSHYYPGPAYFKLSQVDYDGTTEQLAIIYVKSIKTNKRYYDLQGRPTTEQATGFKIVHSNNRSWKEYRTN